MNSGTSTARRSQAWTFAGAALLLGLLLGGVPGCATTSVGRADLPEQPIAVTYWDSADARRRVDILEDAKKDKQSPRREGVAQLEHLGALVGIEERRSQKQLARFPGYLALVYPRTAKVERVRAAPAGARPLAWSSEGRRLMFASGHSGDQAHLFEYDLDTKEVRRLTSGREIHLAGAYGPSGRIAYVGVLRQGSKVRSRFYVTPESGAHGEVIAEGIQTTDLAWSHEGGAVVFVRRERSASGRPGRRFLVAKEAVPGGAIKRIAPGRDPVISRDGAWVVYSAPSGASWRLRRIRSDGSGRTAMGQGRTDELQPAVSPDGRFVAYVSHQEGEPDKLFVRRFDGTGDRVLLGTGSVANPVW